MRLKKQILVRLKITNRWNNRRLENWNVGMLECELEEWKTGIMAAFNHIRGYLHIQCPCIQILSIWKVSELF